MRSIRKTIHVVLLIAVAGLTQISQAQYSSSDSTNRDTVRRIQSRIETLRSSIQSASNRGNASTATINDLNRLISDLATATNQLDRRLSIRRASSADVRVVLDRATLIDNFFANYRLGFGSQREWQAIRSDLDQLANAYAINWQWNSGSNGGNTGGYTNDRQVRQLIQRIDNRSTTFSRSLRQDLNRRNYGRYPADQVSQQLTSFETALVQLRNRVNTRSISGSDVQNLLQSATFLNRYVSDEQLSYQTENNWTELRTDLDSLANTFNVAWNWSTAPGGDYGSSTDLTGTFRLTSGRGDDVRRAAEQATRNLSAAERQRVYDQLLRRLDPPDMLAIDQRGNTVSIASTRAPEINFVADGREQVETTQRGRTVRVRADLNGDRLTIVRNGDRSDDFTVTFDPINNRQLLVTRTIYSDRLSQPVVVRNYYDKVSDVAQLNLYQTNPEVSEVSTVNGDFVIPSGTQVVAILNTDLSTRNVSPDQRFTATIRTPGEYAGATLEGRVIDVQRSGRVTGRAGMTLDFDTIRTRDGRTYRFAGILESVSLANGEVVRVDNEGAVREDDNQTNKTITRTAIGSAVGAIIGAIAGGGKGAAIGAAIGAGAGAGSVYVQGRDDLELSPGTEVTIRATGTRS
jgi:outer membrane lipoprotein SlyB